MKDRPNTERVVFFDCESTGTDPYQDRIWELAFQEWSRDGSPDWIPRRQECWRFDPGMELDDEVVALTGISREDLEDHPPFSRRARGVQNVFDGATLVGYNIRSFDTILLDAELERANQPGLDLSSVQEVDLYRLWTKLEPRTLEGALKRFLGVELGEDAHRADADTRHLPDLMMTMARTFVLEWSDLKAGSQHEGEVDRSGRFRVDDDGVVVFAFGKHQGKPVADHASYLSWMMGADFPEDTKDAIRKLRRNNYQWPEADDGRE